MRVQIGFRDPAVLEQIRGFPQYMNVDKRHYCEMPDDTLSFFAAVEPLGRFELIPPHTRHESDECWVVELHNDYD
jgi:hypothetical protein